MKEADITSDTSKTRHDEPEETLKWFQMDKIQSM